MTEWHNFEVSQQPIDILYRKSMIARPSSASTRSSTHSASLDSFPKPCTEKSQPTIHSDEIFLILLFGSINKEGQPLKKKTIFAGIRTRMTEANQGTFVECIGASTEYDSLLKLRFDTLRTPLGLDWQPGELRLDRNDRHFGIFYDTDPLAVTVVRRQSEDCVKLRQIAVHSTMRGQGLGRRIIEAVEDVVRNQGVRRVELNSRLNVTGFYEAMGYFREGDEFLEIGIPHVKMKKML